MKTTTSKLVPRRMRLWLIVVAAICCVFAAHNTMRAFRHVPETAVATASPPMPSLPDHVRIVDDIEPVAGYDRSCSKSHACVFGPAWNDPTDTSGCDTRNRLLAAQLIEVQFKPGTYDCKVIAGSLSPDPYTGNPVALNAIDIDHIYPLSRAWDAGAWQWTARQRQLFANDPAELLAVSSHANRSKSDSGLSWLPTLSTVRLGAAVFRGGREIRPTHHDSRTRYRVEHL